MKTDSLIEIAARLSDARELLTRNRVDDAIALLEETKKELFFRAHDDAGTELSFADWCKSVGLFVSFDKPGGNEYWHKMHDPKNFD